MDLEFLKKDTIYSKKKFNFLKNSINEEFDYSFNLKEKTEIIIKKKFIFFTKNIIEKNLNCLYIRKSKFFNKGRYSRNRQIYRTGVYICFFINIIALYLLWFVFYKFSIKFTYLWWLFILLPACFILPKSLKYNLFFYKNFFFYVVSYLNWIKNFFKF